MIDKIITTSEVLKRYLFNRKVSQKELAEEFGIAQSYLSAILNDKKPANDDFLNKFDKKFLISNKDKENIRLYEKFKKIDPEWKKLIYSLIENSNNSLKDRSDYSSFLEFKKAFEETELEKI